MTAALKDRARNLQASGRVRAVKPTLLTACPSRPTIQIVRYIAKTVICQRSRIGDKFIKNPQKGDFLVIHSLCIDALAK